MEKIVCYKIIAVKATNHTGCVFHCAGDNIPEGAWKIADSDVLLHRYMLEAI